MHLRLAEVTINSEDSSYRNGASSFSCVSVLHSIVFERYVAGNLLGIGLDSHKWNTCGDATFNPSDI